jgi:thiamine phosphate synthase YjbQ (UPF0047 family)
MACQVQHLELHGSSGTDIHDVTPQALTAVSQSGVRQGLLLGAWQQIVVLDLDKLPRQRRVVIQVLGE